MELITRYCSDKGCFTYFRLQCRRRQKQICSFCKNFMQLLQFYYVTIHSAFRYVFGNLSDICNCKIFFLPQRWWSTVMQVPYIMDISPLFFQQCKQCCKLDKEEKNIFKNFLCSSKWRFFPVLSVFICCNLTAINLLYACWFS